MLRGVRSAPEKGPYIGHYSGLLIQQGQNNSSLESESAEMLGSVREIISPTLVRYGLAIVE